MESKQEWDGENRRKRQGIDRHLVRYRVLSIIVMAWSGYVMQKTFDWMAAIPHDQIGMHHAGLVAAIYAPIAAIFKFAFDFALDGKIHND